MKEKGCTAFEPAKMKGAKTMKETYETPCIEVSVLSVQESEFTNKDTGEKRKMWRVYAADPTGAVGSVWSNEQYFPGDIVRLSLAVNREGRFTARISK